MNFSFFPWRSLKARVTLLTLAIFLSSMWTLNFYASRMLREDMQQQLSSQQLSTVGIIAGEINQQLGERLRALEEVAVQIRPALLGDTPALQNFLEVRPILKSLFNSGVLVTWLDGTASAAVPFSAKWIGVNYMDVDAVADAIREIKPSIGRPVIDKELQAPVVLMAAPIRNAQGSATGALVGVTSLGKPSFLENITRKGYGKTGSYSIISRQHRQVVTSSEQGQGLSLLPAPGVNPVLDRALSGEEGSAVYINTRGTEVLSSTKGIPVANWYLAASLPVTEAFAPIHDMQRRMLLATLVLTLLAGGLTWWLLRRQLLPLEDTVKTLAALSSGDLPAQELPVQRQDEIGELIKGFNRLLQMLAKREALLKQVLDTSSVAIFLLDLQGYITLANQRMAEMFGYDLGAILGKEYLMLVHPSEREVARKRMETLLVQNIPAVDLDRLFLRADGSQFWGHLTRRSFFDADSAELTIVVVIADIAERKKAEQKLMLAASVFTHAREGIIITDANGIMIEVNDAFSRITGYGHDEVIGQNPRILNSGRQDLAYYSIFQFRYEPEAMSI